MHSSESNQGKRQSAIRGFDEERYSLLSVPDLMLAAIISLCGLLSVPGEAGFSVKPAVEGKTGARWRNCLPRKS
jgi:hypothetical protein